jgi:N12 class adenine-specific DNA methylase/2'-5' RNA ligase
MPTIADIIKEPETHTETASQPKKVTLADVMGEPDTKPTVIKSAPAPSLWRQFRDSDAMTALSPSENVQRRDAVLVKQPDGTVKDLGYKPFGSNFEKYGLTGAHPDDLIPKATNEGVEQAVEPFGVPKPVADIAAGTERAAAEGAESLINPVVAGATLFGGGLPPLVSRGLSAVFAPQMIKGAWDHFSKVYDSAKKQDWGAVAENLAGGGLDSYFGVVSALHTAKPGLVQESPMMRDILTTKIQEKYTPEQVRATYQKVNQGKGTPAENELVRFINSEVEHPKEAIQQGATVTTEQPRNVRSEALKKWLGLDKVEGSKTITVGDVMRETGTEPQPYQPGDDRVNTSEPGQPLAIEGVTSPSATPSPPAGPVQESEPPDLEETEVEKAQQAAVGTAGPGTVATSPAGVSPTSVRSPEAAAPAPVSKPEDEPIDFKSMEPHTMIPGTTVRFDGIQYLDPEKTQVGYVALTDKSDEIPGHPGSGGNGKIRTLQDVINWQKDLQKNHKPRPVEQVDKVRAAVIDPTGAKHVGEENEGHADIRKRAGLSELSDIQRDDKNHGFEVFYKDGTHEFFTRKHLDKYYPELVIEKKPGKTEPVASSSGTLAVDKPGTIAEPVATEPGKTIAETEQKVQTVVLGQDLREFPELNAQVHSATPLTKEDPGYAAGSRWRISVALDKSAGERSKYADIYFDDMPSRKELETAIREEQGTEEKPKGSTQVTLPANEAKPFQEFAKSIPDADVYEPVKGEKGRELEPHVTALFGLTDKGDNAQAVRDIVKKSGLQNVKLKLGKTSLFSNNPEYDVLKVDVDSPDLHKLNKALSSLPNENEHPDYHPHLTIAYLKKGTGKKYVGDPRFEGKEITIGELTHSDADHRKTPIPFPPSSPPAPATGTETVDKPPQSEQSTQGVTNEPLEGKGREPRPEATNAVGPTPEDASSGEPQTPVQRPPEEGRPDTVPAGSTTAGETGLRPSSERWEQPEGSTGANPERLPDQPATTGAGESAGEPGSGGERVGVSGEPVSSEPVEPAEKAPSNARNFVLTDLDMFETGGDKAKFKDNIAAIRLMKAIMEEQRPATPEEQQILAKYVGWGRSSYSEGLFGYYGETARKWENERNELEALLTSEELERARSSTKNAHYTSPKLAKSMWDMAQRMGFKGGIVNEPAEGTGVFWGTMPGAVSRRSSLVGSEMDTLTSNIAKLLYPGGQHETASYQETILPSNFFDLQISNYPFGDIVIRQDQYNKVGAVLHDYFFLKGIDTVRPGGLLMAITSTGTMDKGNTRVRELLASKADLVAAIRLPSGAFLKNAGTDVVTDILILKKRGDLFPKNSLAPRWANIREVKAPGTAEPIPINEYFADHPDQILGTLDRKSKLYGGGQPHVSRTDDFEERLQKAIERLPENLYETRRQKPPAPRQIIEADSRLKDYGYQVKDGKLWQRQGNEMVQREMSKEKLVQVGKILSVRDDVRNIIAQELAGVNDEALTPLRETLNRHYDDYIKKYGNLHSKAHKGFISDDPGWPVLVSLENYNPETKEATKADIFSRRTVKSITRPEKAENIKQAVGISMNETGSVEPERIAALTGSTPDKVIEDLVAAGLAFRVPGGGLELGDYYLSGNVRAKLIQAEAAAKIDQKYAHNVEALKKVIPEDKPHSEIDVRLGSPWVASPDYQNFFSSLLKSRPESIAVNFLQKTGKWILETRDKYLSNKAEWNQTYGTEYAGFLNIVQAAMDDKPIMIYKTVKTAEGEKRELMADETAAANLKVEEVRELFKEWVWQDDERRVRLHRFYNDNYNNIVDTEHDGSWLEFPTMDAAVKPYPHQKNAIARTAHTRKVLLGHEVGTGKSLIYGMAAAKMKELGFANKPALAVLKANIEQVQEEIQRAFPTMKILSTNENFDADNRKKTIARMATGDWDLVILTHDNLNMMDVEKDVEQQFIQEEINELDDVIRAAEGNAPSNSKRKDKTTKQLEKLKERLEEKLKEALDRKRDPAISFQKSGIDMLMIDEAHVYKSLPVYTSRGSVKGIPQSRSDRATNLLMNTRWMTKNNPKAVMIFGTGTPIDNSMVELYNWQKFLQMDELVSRGIESFDGWANTFGQTVTSVEPTAAGEFKPTTRFKRFTNLQELSSIARLMLDTRFIEDMPNIKRPKKMESIVKADMNREQASYMALLAQRAKDLKGKKVEKGGDNMLLICTDGRKAAMHMGLVTPNYTENPEGKVAKGIAAVLANHKADPTVTQMIFSDLGVNPTDWGFSLYKHIIDGLVKGGIPRNKIIDFTKLKEGDDRLAAIAKLRSGDALVGIGSTATMGTGVNAQRHLRHLHHIDAPMTPGRMRQRDGRGWRQGNEHKEVGVVRYVTEGSLDAFIWSLINNKDNFIQQFLKYGAKVREIEELDSEELSPARVMAEASGNPDVLNAIELQEQIKKLEQKKRIFSTAQARTQSQSDAEKRTIDRLQRMFPAIEADTKDATAVMQSEEKQYLVGGKTYTDQKAPLNKAIETAVDDGIASGTNATIIRLGPFKVTAVIGAGRVSHYLLEGQQVYEMGASFDEQKDGLSIARSALGMIRSIGSGRYVERYNEQIKQAKSNLDTLQKQGQKKYDADEELTKAKRELSTVMARLSKSSKEGGSTDTDVKVSAAEKKLEDLTGPNRVNQLKELSEKLTWTPETYLSQLQKEIEAIDGKQHGADDRPDKGIMGEGGSIINPAEVIQQGYDAGKRYYQEGKRRFSDWAKEMLREFGEKIRNFLKEIWDRLTSETGSIDLRPEDERKTVYNVNKEGLVRAKVKNAAGEVLHTTDYLKTKEEAKAAAQAFNKPPVEPPPATPEPEKPSEPEKPVTGIRNAIVDEERVKRGLAPAMQAAKRGFGTVWDAAMQEIHDNPAVQDDLIEELKARPRALTDREDALLLHRQIDLQNQFDKATGDLVKAQEGNDESAMMENRQRVAKLSDDLLDLYNVGKTSGTETGRGLNARKMLVHEDFSLARMTITKRAGNNGEPLTDAQAAEVKRLHDKIAELEAAHDKYVADTEERIRQIETTKAVEEAKKKVRGKKSGKTSKSITEAIEGKLEEGVPITDLGSFVQRLAESFVEEGITDREPLIDAVHDVLKGLDESITRRDTMDAISGYGKFRQLNPDEIKAKLRDLKGQMQQVAKLIDMQEGRAPAKTGVERRAPSDEERRLIKQVEELKRRGGYRVTDPASQLRTALQAVKTRLRNDIADMTHQLETGQKPLERTKVSYDLEATQLKAVRDQLKQSLADIEGKSGRTEEQRQKAVQGALERSIAEYTRRIKDGDLFRTKKAQNAPSTPVIEALRARRDALRDELKAWQELAKLKPSPEEVALKQTKARLSKSIADMADKLANEDFSPRTPRKPVEMDAEALRLKAESERLKAQFREGVNRDRLKERTLSEKAEDTFVKWRRAFILSGPVTLAKLTSAAMERMVFTPAEEAIGAGLSLALPRVAERAGREGGASVSAEAKAITEGFTTGMQDAWQILRTGKSDLDVLYGKHAALPQSLIDFMGNVHGALKAAPKRNEFARSFQKRTVQAMRAGYDVTDPNVQMRLAIEAYKDANRSIFMQDNMIVDMWKWAQKRALKPTKSTGRPTAAGKATATAMNTLLPIVKVPTNIVGEVLQYALGSITGSARLARAMAAGMDNLEPEEADTILRLLKKGLLGAALLLLGYLGKEAIGGYYQYGQKRKPGDVPVGGVRIFGHDVPSYLVHNPLLEMLQIGATIGRVADSHLRKKDKEVQGIGAGSAAAAWGLLDEVPFINETAQIARLGYPFRRGAFVGGLAESVAVPQLVKTVAESTDKTPEGEVVRRKPQSPLDYVKLGIPGLRETVPVPTKDDVKKLDVPNAVKVYQQSTPDERRIIRGEIVKKIYGSKTLTGDERAKWLQIINSLNAPGTPTESDIARKYAN